MKYLIDTHVIIWHYESLSKIPPKIGEIIYNRENSIYLSSISLLEMAVKVNIGKLKLNITFDELLNHIENGDFIILQIENEYLKRVAELPLIHKDPFDRLLVSTALTEDIKIITADENIQRYDVPWVW